MNKLTDTIADALAALTVHLLRALAEAVGLR